MPRSGFAGMNGASCPSGVSIERAVLPASRAGFDGMIVDHCAGGSGRFVVSLAVQMRPVEEVIDPSGQRSLPLRGRLANARCAAMDVVPMTRGSPDPR